MKTGEPNGEMSAEQKKMEAYLEEKYGQEFVVEDISPNDRGLGNDEVYSGLAFPVSNPSLHFPVSWNNTSKHDKYIASLLSAEGNNEIRKIITQKIYSNNFIITNVGIEPIGSLENITDTSIKLKDIREKNPDNLELHLRLSSEMDGLFQANTYFNDMKKQAEAAHDIGYNKILILIKASHRNRKYICSNNYHYKDGSLVGDYEANNICKEIVQ